MKKSGLHEYVYDLSVDYDSAGVDSVLDIQIYFVKKYDIKWCLDLLNSNELLYY